MRHPAGETVVLLSSIGTTHEAWSKVIPALEHDYRVITVDHRGHGASEVAPIEPGSATVKDLCDDILQALDGVGVDRFAVVGLSLGGALAQYLAATSGRVTKAVFACTATYLGGEEKWSERTATARGKGMDAMADGFVENWFTEGYREAQPEEVRRIRDMAAGVDAEGYAQCGDALAKWDFADQLDQITCPVCTIAGAQDPGTPPEELAKIAAGVAGPVESHVIDPGSHQLAVERPEEFIRVLTQFLGD
ncbi:alpha/beta fold hydrolase [Corynebacterium aquatimens]|nr:alpha/beta fold hydrolase [Corynebacterium aquatimens]